ncbi:hypothetical protein CCR75_002422 [Bremia lactucae]|uniref:Uncharacterized protein n=1 Tax=Bremia lactucae TaxID=4779 RepID=A0A976ICK4_BRELC|nr:hypothetical protein CCR75_002422 [Bremia lactucae]
MVTFTLHGVLLEKITTHRVLGEFSMTFVFCALNAVVAFGLSHARKEKPSAMPSSFLAIVGALAFGSTIASMMALRYVTYITRILGKSCKSIPVMIMGVLLGKKYAIKKYVSVFILSIGVAIFLLGTPHEHKRMHQDASHHHLPEHERTPNMALGFSLLALSLVLDGATGALEDKFMESYDIGAFDLMFHVNIYKAFFAAAGLVVNDEVPVFLQYIVPLLPSLLMLSFTGAFGQAFIFFAIYKFGALTTTIIGTCRKVLSIVLSVIYFGHVLSIEQTTGLVLFFFGLGLSWVSIKNCFGSLSSTSAAANCSINQTELSKEGLLETCSDMATDSGSDEQDSPIYHKTKALGDMSVETVRQFELINAWYRQTACKDAKLMDEVAVFDANDVAGQVI